MSNYFARHMTSPEAHTENAKRFGGPLRDCCRCAQQRIPEGGIDMAHGKWVCAACWASRMRRKVR